MTGGTGTGMEIRECEEEACGLRFPQEGGARLGERCPRCRGRTRPVHQVTLPVEAADAMDTPPTRLPLTALVDNVRSLFNVGSIFRSADGAGCGHLYLCGITPTPEHPKLAKTALGAEQSMPWSYHPNAVQLALALRAGGHQLWVLEAGAQAQSLFSLPPSPVPVVLIVGNERAGVDPGLLALCHRQVAIPMRGAKRSLNVATAFGVAAVVLAEGMTGDR